MLTPSAEIINAFEQNRDVTYEADVTLANGTYFVISEDELVAGGCSISTQSGSSAFPVGQVYCSQLTLNFYNPNDKYKNVDFYNARVIIKGTYNYEDDPVVFRMGYFTVTQPEEYGDTIQIIGYDDLYKTDKEFSGGTFPMSLSALFSYCLTQCTISSNSSTYPSFWSGLDFTNYYVMPSAPENVTYRQVMGGIALVMGANLYIDPDTNILKMVSLADIDISSLIMYDGGYFDDGTPLYTSGDSLYGGIFDPWDTGDDAEEPAFDEDTDVIVLHSPLNAPTLGRSDLTITGVRAEIDGESYYHGTDGYVLTVDSPILAGGPQKFINSVGIYIEGFKFRPFTMDYQSYPFAWIMSMCQFVDQKGHGYNSLITDIDFTLKGITSFKCTAETPTRNAFKSGYQSEAKTAQTAVTEVKKGISGYEQEMTRLTNLLINAFGAFKTEEPQPDGGSIFYLHDKPTLSGSSKIWKMTAEGFTVSTDGGQTWTAGMDAYGNAVLNVLSAIGIRFDWARGGTLTLGGYEDGYGQLYVYDAEGSLGMLINRKGAKYGYNGRAYFTGNYVSHATTYFKSAIHSTLWRIAAWTPFYGETEPPDDLRSQQDANVAVGGRIVGMNAGKGSMQINLLLLGEGIDVWGRLYDGTNETIMTIDPQHDGANVYPILVKRTVKVDASIYGNNLYINSSGVKQKTVESEDYGTIGLYAYETSSPYFGDIGEGQTDDTGVCYVDIEAIFNEAISGASQYVVFLQKEGEGDIWVDSKEPTYFVVRGTPNLRFAWELKARQAGFENDRLLSKPYYDNDLYNYYTDFEQLGAMEYEKYVESKEEL